MINKIINDPRRTTLDIIPPRGIALNQKTLEYLKKEFESESWFNNASDINWLLGLRLFILKYLDDFKYIIASCEQLEKFNE